MKKVLIALICCFAVFTASAQFGRLKRQKKVADVPFTIDSFTYKGETVPIQRYQREDLNVVFGDNANENRVVLAINKLQEQLINMHVYLLKQREINFIAMGEQYLAEIRNEHTGFDCSNFQKEYDLYKKYEHGQSADEEDAQKQQWIREIQTIRSEDPHVITPYDSALAATYKGPTQNAPSALKAIEKIERVHREQEQQRRDSLAEEQRASQAIIDSLDALQAAKDKKAFEKQCLKKYGARYGKAVANGEVLLGMNMQMCEDAWGPPLTTNRNITKDKVTVKWIYNFRQYLIFKNGLVTTINE